MDKPKCRLCGERHYGLCGGGFTEAVVSQPPASIVERQVEAAAAEAVPQVSAGHEQESEPVLLGSGGRFDRAAYQREYMKRWRAKRRQPS